MLLCGPFVLSESVCVWVFLCSSNNDCLYTAHFEWLSLPNELSSHTLCTYCDLNRAYVVFSFCCHFVAVNAVLCIVLFCSVRFGSVLFLRVLVYFFLFWKIIGRIEWGSFSMKWRSLLRLSPKCINFGILFVCLLFRFPRTLINEAYKWFWIRFCIPSSTIWHVKSVQHTYTHTHIQYTIYNTQHIHIIVLCML